MYNAWRPIPFPNGQKPRGNSSFVSAAEGDARLAQRVSFDLVFTFVLLPAFHGVSALKILVILSLNYCIATQLPRKYIPVVTWVFNIGTLFANELSEGYKLAKMVEYISPIAEAGLESGNFWRSWAWWIDSHGGLMRRWEVLFNITVLRLISFNLDYYWSLDRRGGSPIEVSFRSSSPSYSSNHLPFHHLPNSSF